MDPGNGDAARVAAMVIRNQETLLRVALQVSLCADDAHDAVQRALETYLTRLPLVDERTELAWLKVVVRNEALTVRRSRSLHVTAEDVDLDAQPAPSRDPHERALSTERVGRAAEALRGLKPDEARALLAKSMGLSYQEIGRRFNWSYTKTNRALTEGRARFRRLYDELEDGRECARHAPALAAIAAGEPAHERAPELRVHMRNCAACRAAVRAARGGVRARAAAAVALPLKWLGDRLGQAKAEAYAWSVRAGEIAAAAPLGGGRATAATALVGVCLGGSGYCVTKGLLDESRRPAQVAAIRTVPASEGRARPRTGHPTPIVVRRAAPRPAATAPMQPGASAPRAPRRATTPPERGEFELAPATSPRPAPAEFSPAPPTTGGATEFSATGGEFGSVE